MKRKPDRGDIAVRVLGVLAVLLLGAWLVLAVLNRTDSTAADALGAAGGLLLLMWIVAFTSNRRAGV